MTQSIFPTPIFTYKVNPNLADRIENIIVPRLNQLQHFGQMYTDYYDNRIILPEEISDLFQVITNKAHTFLEEIGIIESSKINYWIQDYAYKDHHNFHNHGIIPLSGVYWVRANEEAGDFVFRNPIPILNLSPNIIKKETKYNSTILKIKPKKGEILLFPSYLEHSVESGGVNGIRTTLAFNFVS